MKEIPKRTPIEKEPGWTQQIGEALISFTGGDKHFQVTSRGVKPYKTNSLRMARALAHMTDHWKKTGEIKQFNADGTDFTPLEPGEVWTDNEYTYREIPCEETTDDEDWDEWEQD